MNDYKDLIVKLRQSAQGRKHFCTNRGTNVTPNYIRFMFEAADAIEQLVAEYKELDELNDSVCSEYRKVKKERDAAIEDLKECGFRTTEECHYCKHNFAETAAEHCDDCDGNSEWEWRGVKEDEDEAH